MKYKLLVLDVDGTLLNEAKEITKRTLSALLKVQQMGVRIVLASGRPTYGLMPLAKALELGNYGGFILSYNGCQIIRAENGEVLFERRINPEMLPYLEKKARKNGFAIFTYHDDTIITNDSDNRHIRNEALLNNLKIIKEEEFPLR
ncbi:haloacid dehalogenase-like hydrolase [Bacteroides pyogenes JCM 10003]|nr:haloacid dehalogenase-like hydrolase [Bacteroides pyogenes JCM 10003]